MRIRDTWSIFERVGLEILKFNYYNQKFSLDKMLKLPQIFNFQAIETIDCDVNNKNIFHSFPVYRQHI